MNIPEHILQQVADEAFLPSSKIVLTTSNIFDDWKNQAKDRRAVIQHAISNPALAPFLVSGIGEYTDMEIADAWRSANHTMPFVSEIKRFLSSLPRRESPALAEALEEAGNRQAALLAACTMIDELKAQKDRWYEKAKRENELYLKEVEKYADAIARAEKAEAELARLKSELAHEIDMACQAHVCGPKLGILRPIAEMQETVPEGCMAVFRWRDDFGSWVTGTCEPTNGFFAILRLPSAEATPQAQADPYDELKAAHASGKVIQRDLNADADNEDWRDENPDWKSHPTCYRIKPEPAAQVPLGPEDCPPGSVVRCDTDHWFQVLYASPIGVCINNVGLPVQYRWIELAERWQINTSIPDTGRWDANAWRPCSKPAGKEVAK